MGEYTYIPGKQHESDSYNGLTVAIFGLVDVLSKLTDQITCIILRRFSYETQNK